jgi:hypothetical protein
MTSPKAQLNREAVQRTRHRIMRSRDRFWKVADMSTPVSTTQHLFADLVEQGELRRIRRGLYWRGTKTPLGMAPPSPGALVLQIAEERGTGPAGLSAANILRLSTQIPRYAEYAVVGRRPTDGYGLRFVSRSARHARVDNGLSQLEVAALEVLDGWDQVIEAVPDEAMRRLAALLRSGAIRADRLAQASETEPASARARLRYLLQKNGYPNLADTVPPTDPRTEAKALEDLVDA